MAVFTAYDAGSQEMISLQGLEESLVVCKGRNYWIAETEDAALAAAHAYHSCSLSGDWVRETRHTVDRLAEDVRLLGRKLSRVEYTIYAATREEYEQVQGEVKCYCRTRLPGARLSFCWYTPTLRLDAFLFRERETVE